LAAVLNNKNKKCHRCTSTNKMAAPVKPIYAHQTSLQHKVKFSCTSSYKGEFQKNVLWGVTPCGTSPNSSNQNMEVIGSLKTVLNFYQTV
jgi:hypothetical protein